MAYKIEDKGKKKPVHVKRKNYDRDDTAPINSANFEEDFDRDYCELKEHREGALRKLLKVLFTLGLVVLLVGTVGFAMLPSINTIQVPKTPEAKGIVEDKDLNLDGEEKTDYMSKRGDTLNILLIGVDGEGYKGNRADVMMIMSLNKQTKTIRLVSIQRDTMAYLPMRETYEKLNHSFAYDGAVGTLKAVNQNYDLDIDNFVVFDFKALEKMVDAIGGVEVDIDENEYDSMVSSGVTPPGTGMQRLNGAEALMYARIRYNSGGDPGRNERQREILSYVFKQSKNMGLGQMKDLAYGLLPNIQTSYDYAEILSLLQYYETIKSSSEIQSSGFPFEQEGMMIDDLSYVIPNSLESNVIQLHQLLFGFDNYKPSDRVMEYNRYIGDRTGLF